MSLLLTCLVAGVPYAAHSDLNFATESHARYDDNVGNAGSYRDILGDSIVGAALSMFQLYPLAEGYSVTVGADLHGDRYNRFGGLSNVSVDGTLALKKKWGLGAFVPWGRIGVAVARNDFDEAYRNASVYRGTLEIGQRIDERWNVWAEYAYERRSADTQPEEVPGVSGDAFSQNRHNLAANAEFSWSERTVLSCAVLFRHGDVVSTTAASYKIFAAASAIAEDPALGPEAYAYRLTGTTVGFRAGMNYSLTPQSAIGVDFLRLDTRADGGNTYTKSMPEITWRYHF